MAHYFIEIRDLDEQFASAGELDLRNSLMEAIEHHGLGKITGAGSGFGCMDLSVEIDDSLTAYNALLAFMHARIDPNRLEITKSDEPDPIKEDRARLKMLGEEIGPEDCRMPSCSHLRVERSIFCRIHHFHQVWGRFPAVDSAE